MAEFIIRPFEGGARDYEGYGRVVAVVWPEYPETPAELKHKDERREAKIQWRRFFAELNGEIVGVAEWSQSAHTYHPQKFHLEMSVRPEQEGKGIGAALYDTLLTTLAPHDPITLRAFTREDKTRALKFLADRGFEEEMREQESALSVADFEPLRFADDLARADREGVAIRSYRELEDDTDRDHKLYELEWKLEQDVPHTGEATKREFAEWAKVLADPQFLPDGVFVAVDKESGAYVGVSQLYRQDANDELNTGLTGVARSHRKRGVATALKVRALTYAKKRGAPLVRTWNEENNVGMLGINFRLGFAKTPGSIEFVKHLREEA